MVKLPDNTFKPNVAAIFAAYEAREEQRRKNKIRGHLGASMLGHECERYLWIAFRWAFTATGHPGRILRLFETGELEEARFTENLRMIGVRVLDRDPATGEQWQVRDETGHVGGSLDGTGLGIIGAEKTEHVLEYKTHNDKSYKHLIKHGVKESKPLHWVQMQVYMHLKQLTRAFYLARNKNDDDLHEERAQYDAALAIPMIKRGQRVVGMTEPPERLSEDETHFKCRQCDFHALCHGSEGPPRNCRTCLSSTPIDGGKWYCVRHAIELDLLTQQRGCNWHRFIPRFLEDKDWKQSDAGENAEWIEYTGPDGSTWKDEGI